MLVGGTDGGASEPVLELVRDVVRVALYLMGEDSPQVRYAGNQVLADEVTELFEAIGYLFRRLGNFNLLLFSLAIAVYTFLMIGPLQRFLGVAGFRWTGYLALVLGGTFLIQSSKLKLNITQCIVAALLVSASGYKIATFLPYLTNSPFSLGWSEGSRYYYASLYLSKQLY